MDPQTGPILFRNYDRQDLHTLDGYLAGGGYAGLRKALAMEPDAIIDEVKASGLRGRGGAGFGTGLKWSFVPKPKDNPKARFIVNNADEGEPGTCKDRIILERDPHSTLEGMAIACLAIGAKVGYVYVRGEFGKAFATLQAAVDEAEQAGYLGANVLGSGKEIRLYLHRGAGAYICGEETGLIESLEGKKGQPRLKPPFPAIVGAFGGPTVVNNVETLSSVPWIIVNGAQEYRKFGTEKSPGTKLWCMSGPIKRPGVYEIPLGYPFMKLLEEDCGGMRDGKKLKAVIPGGSSTPVLTAAECADLTIDYEGIASKGSMLGSGGCIVMNEDTCMVRALLILEQFYAHESCGQCSPCREGTGWLAKILARFEAGRGRVEDLDLVLDIGQHMVGKTICVLADAAEMPARSFITKFRHEFEEHAKLGLCPRGGRLVGPLVAVPA